MDRWKNAVAVVTGASSGIGAAVATDLINSGVCVVALARRLERLQENKENLPKIMQSRYHPIKCDGSNEVEVKAAFEWIDEHLGGVDILVNNAGVIRPDVKLISPDNTVPIREILDTNVMAVMYCVRETFNSMKKRNVAGHVVIINSIVGHKVPIIPGSSSNMYSPSKFAVTAMVETYRQEFSNEGTEVKVTSISPGVVDTQMLQTSPLKSQGIPALKDKDVSNAIMYVLGTSPHVQIHEQLNQSERRYEGYFLRAKIIAIDIVWLKDEGLKLNTNEHSIFSISLSSI